MRFVASKALSAAAFFLATVAVLINAPPLFYMATTLIATIGGSHLQAYLAVRGLRFQRVAPGRATVGETIAMEIIVWSERRIRRPLITVEDRLPKGLMATEVSPSLPIAPAYDQPVRTRYTFCPGRRGRFRWKGVVVEGTDALGLVGRRRTFMTEETELIVLPRPISVGIELPLASGHGLSENESGANRGAGLDLWGLRAYVPGDPLRRIHWRSSARAGTLLVKEFEAGSHAAAAFLLPLKSGSDLGEAPGSALDVMVGHIAFLSHELLRQGARVHFPQLEDGPAPPTGPDRADILLLLLAEALADRSTSLADDLRAAVPTLRAGSAVYIGVARPEPDLPDAIAATSSAGVRVAVLLYDPAPFARATLDPDFAEALTGAGAQIVTMPAGEAA